MANQKLSVAINREQDQQHLHVRTGLEAEVLPSATELTSRSPSAGQGKFMQAQVKLLVIRGFQSCFTAAPTLTFCTVICAAGYKNLDAVSSFADGDLGCLCHMLSNTEKWSLTSCNCCPGCMGGTESNSWCCARKVTGGTQPWSHHTPLPQFLKNTHQPDKALILREGKEEGELSSTAGRAESDTTSIRRPLLTDKKQEGFFFYLSVKVYFCYSNLASTLIHTECSTRALGNDPESNFGI